MCAMITSNFECINNDLAVPVKRGTKTKEKYDYQPGYKLYRHFYLNDGQKVSTYLPQHIPFTLQPLWPSLKCLEWWSW